MIALGYHVVSDRPLEHVRHLYPYKSPEAFERDLLSLRRRFEFVAYGGPVPRPRRGRRPLLLSFDDGYAECYTVVRPILLKHGIPCLFFLVTDVLDNLEMSYRNKASLCVDRLFKASPARRRAALGALGRALGCDLGGVEWARDWLLSLHGSGAAALDPVCRLLGVDVPRYLRTRRPYLTRAQVARLRADGFALGAHTRSHPRLDLLPRRQAAAEILGSCRVVSGLNGGGPVPFAFPFSARGFDLGLLRRLGARGALVGPIFDAFGPFEGGPPRRRPGLLDDRMMADSPWRGAPGRSNIRYLLRAAYGRRAVEGRP